MDLKERPRTVRSYGDALALLQETPSAREDVVEESERCVSLGELTVDFKRHAALVHHKKVPLTYIEWLLLKELTNNAGRMVTHDQLMVSVWGPRHNNRVHLLHIWMSRLRNKLQEQGSASGFIRTVHGVGYAIQVPEGIAPGKGRNR